MRAVANHENYTSRPHILVVDDDTRICDLVSRYLSDQGFVVMSADSAKTARQCLQDFVFDVLVVDVMMPGEDGLSFTGDLKATDDIPVLLLTAMGEAQDRIKGFEAGADDYLPKPFEPRELVLRLESLLRRTGVRGGSQNGEVRIGPWVFDVGSESLLAQDGSRERLTESEANLLRVLAARSGEPVGREELARQCGITGGDRAIDVQVTRLRRKLEDDSKAPLYLKTVRGKGYMLRTEGE